MTVKDVSFRIKQYRERKGIFVMDTWFFWFIWGVLISGIGLMVVGIKVIYIMNKNFYHELFKYNENVMKARNINTARNNLTLMYNLLEGLDFSDESKNKEKNEYSGFIKSLTNLDDLLVIQSALKGKYVPAWFGFYPYGDFVGGLLRGCLPLGLSFVLIFVMFLPLMYR